MTARGRPIIGGGSVGLFGSVLRTEILVILALSGESYPRELARMLSASLSATQLAVNMLELTGVIASRLRGKVRLVELNPKHFCRDELYALLLRLSNGYPHLIELAGTIRRRPRRAGKPL